MHATGRRIAVPVMWVHSGMMCVYIDIYSWHWFVGTGKVLKRKCYKTGTANICLLGKQWETNCNYIIICDRHKMKLALKDVVSVTNMLETSLFEKYIKVQTEPLRNHWMKFRVQQRLASRSAYDIVKCCIYYDFYRLPN